MVVGKFIYLVSGRKKDRQADIRLGTPSINIGNGFQKTANWETKGANRPNNLDTVEHAPTAWFRKFVGNISAVINHNSKKAAPEKHLPIK